MSFRHLILNIPIIDFSKKEETFKEFTALTNWSRIELWIKRRTRGLKDVRKYSFAEISKKLARYKCENNYVGPIK